MLRVWTVCSLVVANVFILFFAINPWIVAWSEEAVTLLVLEAGALVVIGVPVILFQVFVGKKTFRQSMHDSFEAVMDFLVGAA